MSMLLLRLLGTPQISLDGEPVKDFVTRKAQALLFYLAVTQTEHTRDKIAALFWPNLSGQRAKNNLRRILPNLRQLVGDHLSITYQTVAFNLDAPYSLDVESFRGAFADASPHEDLTAELVELLVAKTKLYRGEFLQGFHISDASEFEEWLLLEREHLNQQAIRACTVLAKHYVQSGDTDAGLVVTKRLLELEPWYEVAYHLQMLLLMQSGQRAAALMQYETCQKLLADEFDAVPSAEMTAHYERLKAGEVSINELPVIKSDRAENQVEVAAPALAAAAPKLDCDDMPRAMMFYGRDSEIALFRRWLSLERKTLVGVLGTGGTGKTAFASRLVCALADQTAEINAGGNAGTPFSQIIWRSLINAPSLSTLLCSWLQTLMEEPINQLPTGLYEQLDLLFSYLRKHRCLLVLDNLESILLQGEQAGHFREGYVEYEDLLQRIGETTHRSCLLFTSRELPLIMERLERSYPMVCSHRLKGLDQQNGVRLLRAEGLQDAANELSQLVDRYSGIPLALKLVAETIQDLYGGDTAVLLQERTFVFDDIEIVLGQQFSRLSPLELEILCWLAIEREPISLQELARNWITPPPRRKFLEAVRSLQRRGLIESIAAEPNGAMLDAKYDMRFTLQNVVMEYASELLIDRMFTELGAISLSIDDSDPSPAMQRWISRFSLLKAQSKPYIRDAQVRLLLQPLVRRLLNRWGKTHVIHHLSQWLNSLRREKPLPAVYTGTNIFHLLRLLTPDLRGWNFSHLSMCQADLRSGALAGVNLQSADLSGAAFINTIDLINTIAVSPNGEYLAAGASDGAVYIWRTVDYQLHCVLHHHTRVISSLVFTQDSTLLASSSLDGLICIWELKHTSLLRVLTNNGKSIVALTLHADNHLLAAATTDKVIGLWDLEQTEPQILLQVATNITALAFTPNGQWLIWVGDQQKIHVWDVQSCEQLYLLQGHKEKILTVAFHPQGKFFATGGEDGQICLWDTTTMQPRQVLTGHTDFVLALAFSADGNYLASSGADATVRIWAIATGKQQQLFLGHHGWIKVVVYSPDGQTLISGGYDQTIRFWHVPSGQLQRVLQGYLNRIDLSSFSQDGSRLATCGLDGTIRIWSVATATLLHTLHGPQAATRNMVFSHDNTMLVTAGDDHIVRLWDLPCGRLRHVLRGHRGSARSIAFTPDERAVISGSHDGTLRIWNVASGLLQETLSNVCATIQSAIAVSPQQQYLAFGTVDGAIQVRHLPTNSLVQTLDIAPAKIVVLSFDASGQQLACGTDDGQVLLYTLSNSDKQYRLRHHFHLTESSIWRLLFSPETSQLAWICAGQEIQHFDLATGQTYEPMRTYFGAFCLTFAHDGQTLFTDGRDHAVLMRDAKTGVIRKTLHGHTAGITSINSSPADNVIASTSFDGTIRLWDADDGTCLAVMRVPGPYAGMNITNVTGISSAQRDALIALGAVSDSITPGESPSEIQVSHTAIRLDRSMLAN